MHQFFEDQSSKTKGRVNIDVSMTSYTTFHCHGTVDVVYNPRNREDLSYVVRTLTNSGYIFRKDWNVIGRGSNVLIADTGYRGCLIDMSGDFDEMTVLESSPDSLLIRAEAGVSNGTLLQYLRTNGWGGFEFAFGIPGCIGGGIRMNAGTPQGWFADVLETVELMDMTGKLQEVEVYPDNFSYRDFPLAHHQIVVSGTFLFQKIPHFVIQEKIQTMKNQRKNQPLEYPNIGSVFKNPEGTFAGKLIEEAGLKGLRVGDAQISEKHANFIINLGAATTSDVLSLIETAKYEVKAKFGIELEREVHIIG